MEKIFQKLVEVGTRDIFVEHLNLARYIRNRLFEEIKGADREILNKFYSSQSKNYRKQIEELVAQLVKKYKMNLLLDMVIFHQEFQAG